MVQTISDRILELGFSLPAPAKAVGNYVPRLRIGNMLYISGQLPILNGVPQYTGRVYFMDDRRTGNSAESADQRKTDRRQDSEFCNGSTAVKAAQLCAMNLIAQIAAEVGDDLSQIAHIVRLGGFVNAHRNFPDHATVINGASDLMVAVFGLSIGMHVRAAIGASSLPLSVPVEIEATVALR